MIQRPIFVVTHPRACSTAFERVFMTQRQNLSCVHEPFGDAFYYGPERLSARFENDEQSRLQSGFSESTYQSTLERFQRISEEEGKRLFIKDISYYLIPPDGQSASIAPSIAHNKRGVGTNNATEGNKGLHFDASCPDVKDSEPGNPTVLPEAVLKKFHFTFLIRHPRYSIPSFYRCTIPPLDEETGFYTYMPSESGYVELRRIFDFLHSTQQVGPETAGSQQGSRNTFANGLRHDHTKNGNGTKDAADKNTTQAQICVIDADDLLDDPEGMLRQFCESVDLEYDPGMLTWNSQDRNQAIEAFEKWKGFHSDALESDSLKPRAHRKQQKSKEQEYAEWVQKYGVEGAKVIQQTVDDNIADYEYLKSFSLKLKN